MACAAVAAGSVASRSALSMIPVPSSSSSSASCTGQVSVALPSVGYDGVARSCFRASRQVMEASKSETAAIAAAAAAAESLSASSSGMERPAILDPALQCANLMWFKGAYNTQIFVSEDEPADSVVRRFRKAVMQAGVIPECRRRRFFETPQDIAKRKLQAAQRRNKSRRFTPRPDFAAEKKEGGAAKGSNDDDYWGYTEES